MIDSNEPTGPESRGRLRLVTLGAACLRRVPADGEPKELLGPGKPFAVLVYLASSPGRSATRDHLIDLLWANLDLDSARHALRQALWFLRKELGREAIRSDDDKVVLSIPLSSDRNRFLEAIEAEEFSRAADLYGGEFLPVFAAPGGAEFEKWADMERFRLEKHFLRAAHSLVQERLSEGEFDEATEMATRARDADPLNQASWRLLLEALLAADEQVRAQVEARALEEKLDELGRSPEPALRQLLEAARTGRQASGGSGPEGRLEPELIGREREFAAVLSAWSEARSGRGRHVHVAAAAGLGKSRLLSEVDGRLGAMGARTILLRAHPGERDIRYSLASELAEALAECPGSNDISDGAARVLVGLNPALSDRYSVSSDDGSAEQLRRRVLALKALLEAVAGQEPLAVLIDDLHWADRKSRQVLTSLLGDIAEKSVLVVTTSRSEAETGSMTLDHTRPLILEPLGEGELQRLVSSLGTLPDEGWATSLPRELEAATSGSPLLVLETLRLALAEGWLQLESGVWACHDADGLERELAEGRALRRRVERLPDRAYRLLLLVCVAGRPVTAARLAEARKVEAGPVVQDLRQLEVDGLLARIGDAWTVFHDEIATVTEETAGAEELSRAHRAMGRALFRTAGEEPELLLRAGRQLEKAGDRAGLEDVFRRWLAVVRERGDRRSARRLAADLLGRPPDAAAVEQLLRSLSPWDRLRLAPIRRGALAAAFLLAIAMTAAGVLFQGESTPPEINLLVVRPSGSGAVSGYEIPIRQEALRRQAAIDLAEVGRPVSQLSGLHTRHPILARPLRQQWATVGTVSDSGDWEAFLVSEDGSRRRLTHSPGDDVPTGWSPDGRYLLLKTSRWNRYGWQNIGVLDVETGKLRRLTTGSSAKQASHHDATWSPEGTRIAFRREINEGLRADPPPRLCWITVRGDHEECFVVAGREADLVSWHGADGLLTLVTDSSGRTELRRIELDRHSSETVDANAQRAVASPGGRWLATLRSTSGRSARWHVFPTDQPDHSVNLSGSEDLTPSALTWSYPRAGPGYIDSLAIAAPDTLQEDIPTQLVAEGHTRDRQPIPVPVLDWSTTDSSRAVVDPETGVLQPIRTGPVSIVASAGGWRSDTVHLVVAEPDTETVLVEDWTEQLTRRWTPFGEPLPTLDQHPEMGRVFWARGDGTFYSGVYSRRRFSPSSGLGLEATVSTRRTAPAEQELSLTLRSWDDPQAVDDWDHSTGGLPGSSNSCGVRFPGGDGLYTSSQLATSGGVVDVGRDLGTGEQYTLTLQLFPDGTCGLAVDGRPVFRTPGTGPIPNAPHAVTIGGKSVDTKMLVGRLHVWRGVRDQVDWSRLAGWSLERRPNRRR